MKSILHQDREYFDFHQAGVLQERLNRDTGELSHAIIQKPKNFISAITRIIVKCIFVYKTSPALFGVAMSVPVPDLYGLPAPPRGAPSAGRRTARR
eukprot:SAG31_NODE_5893_length_2270_cov_1.878858_1_plen_95_part_10